MVKTAYSREWLRRTHQPVLSCRMPIVLEQEQLMMQILGRADKATNFIRRGTEEAVTEVTLSAGPGKHPYVVHRRLGKDNLSKYKINGGHSLLYV